MKDRRLRRSPLLLVLIVLAPAALTACGGGSAASARRPAAGPPAPDFRVATIDGQQFALAQQRGHPVLLAFMAAWCTTCVPTVQDVDRLTTAPGTPGDLVVLVVDADATETAADVAAFRQTAGGPARYWAIDRTLQITHAYGVTALDTTILIDRQGRIAYHNTARPTLASLQRQVASLP